MVKNAHAWFLYSLMLSLLLCLLGMKPQNQNPEPSQVPGMGAIPYGGAGCQVWRDGSDDEWLLAGVVQPDLSNASSGTIKWSFTLDSLGIELGDTIHFDIATSGSGLDDPGVDHLSRSDLATDGWDTPSVAGKFLTYQLKGNSGSQPYPDTEGDVFDFPNLDIQWAIVSHDSSRLHIQVKVNADLIETNWTNFMFFIDKGGDGAATNGWGRPIDLNGQTVDLFLGSWVNNAQSGVSFRVWAPNAQAVSLIGDFNNWTLYQTMMANEGSGNWSVSLNNASVGDEYKFVFINEGTQYQRNDARAFDVTNSIGNSVVYDPKAYLWETTDYQRPNWNDMVIYELHLGTFSGSIIQAINKLDYLQELGINAIEIMPLWEFAGDTSWGYNGSFPFTVESSYGSPDELKRFVDEAHSRGIAVLIDVLYNHWGPSDLDLWQYDGWEENSLGGIYFYNNWLSETPWGDTRPDFGRNEVRQYIRDNALYWLTEFRLDGFRIDGTKWIRATDDGGTDIPEGWTLLQWLNDEINAHDAGKIIIAEDLAANEWITKSTGEGGAGFDSQWDVNFVHPIRGNIEAVNDSERSMWSIRDAILASYNGSHTQRVIYTESHDEVANGNARVPEEISPGDAGSWFARKRSTLGGALVFTAPGIPMIFQGQEFLEDGWFDDEDPLDWTKVETYSGILQLYKDLIALRTNQYGSTSGLAGASTNVHHINDNGKVIAFHRYGDGGVGDDVIVVMNFSIDEKLKYRIGFPREGEWNMLFNSDDEVYSDDYSDIGHATTATSLPYDNMPFSGLISLAPYSVQIFSQGDLPSEPCDGDFTGDGFVGIADLLAIIAGWGTPDSDVTGDNMTDIEDLLVVIGAFGPCL